MTREMLEYYHNSGMMPDWAYYQQCNKPIWQALQEQKDKFYREYNGRREQERQEQELQKQMEAEVEKQLEPALEKALGEVLKDFS